MDLFPIDRNTVTEARFGLTVEGASWVPDVESVEVTSRMALKVEYETDVTSADE